jgi:C1A family cysteine protease
MPEIKTKHAARYGWKPDIPDHRDLTYSAHRHGAVQGLPQHVDLRGNMPAVYDQGQLGSCTANALGAAFEFDQIRQKLPSWTPSRLMIYYLERKIEGTIKEDAGATIRDGAKVLAKYGVCPEDQWPYDVDKFQVKPDVEDMKIASQNQVLRYARVDQTKEDLLGVLASGYPVVFGFTVYEGFESQQCAKTGYLQMPGKKDKCYGGHAVVACGYDLEKELLLVRNSWGPKWGQHGYFWMPLAYALDANLADDFWVLYSVEDGTRSMASR